MSHYSLDVLRQRYVVEKRPLEATVEQILRADTRAGARAILASIDKRRFENRSEGQRLRSAQSHAQARVTAGAEVHSDCLDVVLRAVVALQQPVTSVESPSM